MSSAAYPTGPLMYANNDCTDESGDFAHNNNNKNQFSMPANF